MHTLEKMLRDDNIKPECRYFTKGHIPHVHAVMKQLFVIWPKNGQPKNSLNKQVWKRCGLLYTVIQTVGNLLTYLTMIYQSHDCWWTWDLTASPRNKCAKNGYTFFAIFELESKIFVNGDWITITFVCTIWWKQWASNCDVAWQIHGIFFLSLWRASDDSDAYSHCCLPQQTV